MALLLRKGLQRAAARSLATSTARTFSIAPHAADKFVVEFPQEHDGMNIEFNWSLADDDVTPHGDAYRNLSWPKLQALAKDETPAGKPAKIQQVDVDVSFGEYAPVFEAVTEHLSTHAAIFAHDGAVGSYKDDRTRVRVISDSPLVALFAQSLLVRVPTKDVHAARPIVVYVATSGAFATQTPRALLFVDNDDDGVVVAKVVITGNVELATIQHALAAAKAKLLEHAASDSVVLAGDVVLKGDKAALVVNASPAARTKAVNASELYAAHLNIWNAAGVTSFFGGAIIDSETHAKSTKKHVLALADGAAAVNVPCNNLVAHPAAAIFVDTNAKSGSISPKEAAALFAKADTSGNVDEATVEALLTKAATKSYVVASDVDIDAALAKL